MPSQLLYDDQHWRDRANEARALAQQMYDPLASEMMLRIAGGYEGMAEQARARQDEGEPGR